MKHTFPPIDKPQLDLVMVMLTERFDGYSLEVNDLVVKIMQSEGIPLTDKKTRKALAIMAIKIYDKLNPQPSSKEVEKDLEASDGAMSNGIGDAPFKDINSIEQKAWKWWQSLGEAKRLQIGNENYSKTVIELYQLLNSSTTDERTASPQNSNQGTESLTQNSSIELLEALRKIAYMSDPGSYEKAITDMKLIAKEAIAKAEAQTNKNEN
jgi:hypothetical protein